MTAPPSTAPQISSFLEGRKFGCLLADPFNANQTELESSLTVEEICALSVAEHMDDRAHCYLWVPNSKLPDGMKVLQSWGFKYTGNIVWQKSRTTEGQEGDEVFSDVTELLLFGTRGKNVRTLGPARSTVNFIPFDPDGDLNTSGKPQAQYQIIERCSWGPFLELFGSSSREGWTTWSGR
ncbi:hypothetical protein AYJ57_21780 (plasmid) [Salipiger sp. CCB-MM3]|uniref:MT-A70 family methyltransferase n=1 Tax=Salipiger sp. CCB-MM3 TaxID=1792508 RepID=UPI00080AB24F|nr:MT-A70 family methyltransferase [Salipiger sp. CCB-MM3]ANT63102.1 hypothetical protein AYJ57_21780 [Salipiger sp. CCB-MM3]